MPRQCVPDVTGVWPFPLEQEASWRSLALPVPGIYLDSLGALVPHMGTDQLAMAGTWQFLRSDHRLDPMVRVHRYTWRVSLDLGVQPFGFRNLDGS